MLDTAGVVKMNSLTIFTCGLLHVNIPVLIDLQKLCQHQEDLLRMTTDKDEWQEFKEFLLLEKLDDNDGSDYSSIYL